MSASQHLVQLHTKNLLYFRKFYPELFKKLENYQKSSAYELTIEKNCYFDIEDTNNNSYIYGTDSEVLSQQFVDNFLSNKDNKESKKIIFAGTLLGIHIEKCLQTIDVDTCMIIEPDLEMFRFSTFVVDYEQLSKNRFTIFSIEDSQTEFQKKILEFYFTLSQHNHNISTASINNDSKNILSQLTHILEQDVAFHEISKSPLISQNSNLSNISQTYNKAQTLQLKGEFEKASILYKDIIQAEKYIKSDSNFEKNIQYIHHSYLKLGNIYFNNKENERAYSLYGKNVYTDNIKYDIYEASLANFTRIHNIKHFNPQYNRKILENHLQKFPESTIIKNILIATYSALNEFDKANNIMDNHEIHSLPTFYDSQEQIDNIREDFEEKIDQLLLDKKVLSENQLKMTNFFYLANHNRNNRQILSKLAKLYEQRTPSLSYKAQHCKKYKYTGKKIKVGFVSNFFQERHPVGKFINKTIIEFNNDQNIEVFVYSFSKDDLKGRVKKHTLLTGTLKETRKLIAKDKLDILIYPEIGMDSMTYFLAHARLAPVQCVMGGHPSTTGIRNMDYYLSQKDLEIDSAQDHYSEKLIKFENINGYYHKPKVPKEFYSKDDLGLLENSTNYLIPATLQKLHPSFDYILSEIIKKDPNAKLIFFEASSKNNIDSFVKERLLKSIDKKYFSFRRWAQKDEFFSLLYHADAVIEPTIFGFGTTLIEAFSIGTPIVTLPGNFVSSRGAYTYYKAMGVTDLIASDENEYIKLSIKLAKNDNFRDEIREKILKNNDILYKNSSIIGEYKEFFIKTIKEV